MITLGILQLQSRYDDTILRFAMLKTTKNKLYTSLVVENSFQLSINAWKENTKNIKKSEQELLGSTVEYTFYNFGNQHQRPWRYESYLTT